MAASTPRDYYATLELTPSADQKAIDLAFRRLARRYHPDVNPGPEAQRRMAALNEAYATLRDPEKRRLYDLQRTSAFAPARGTPVREDPDPRGNRQRRAYALYPPLLAWSPSVLDLPVLRPGGTVSGFVYLTNEGGGTMSGTVTTSSEQVSVTPRSFEGNDVVLSVSVRLDPAERPRRTPGGLAWRIGILSNGGEAEITLRAPYEPPDDREASLARRMASFERALAIVATLVFVAFMIWLVAGPGR